MRMAGSLSLEVHHLNLPFKMDLMTEQAKDEIKVENSIGGRGNKLEKKNSGSEWPFVDF